MESVDEIFDDANGDLAIGELEGAVEKYRRCVALDPQFFDGWHALGMALMKLGRFPEAIEAGRKTVELKPNDQIGWTSLSLFYNRNGEIKEAEAAGTKAKILSWGGKIAKSRRRRHPERRKRGRAIPGSWLSIWRRDPSTALGITAPTSGPSVVVLGPYSMG